MAATDRPLEIDHHTMNLVCCSALSRMLDTDCEDALSFILEGCDEVDGGAVQDSHVNHSHNVVRNLKGKMSTGLKKSLSALSGMHPKKQSTSSLASSRLSSTLQFGCPIPEDGPLPIIEMLDFLDDCVDVSGLFRVSGNKRRQDELKALSQDESFDIEEVVQKFTPHDIASVVKNYLSELPAPLLQQQFKEIYLQIAELPEVQRVEALQFLLLMLPPACRELLHLLLMTLGRVAENSAVNKMDASNLSIVIAPNLISIPPENQDDMQRMTVVICDMIKNYGQIFTVHHEVELQMRVLLANMQAGEMDAPLALTRTSCAKQTEEQYQRDACVYTGQELLKLFEHVQAMPEGKQKQHLLKKFTSGPMVHKSTGATSRSVGGSVGSVSSMGTPPGTPGSVHTRHSSGATPMSAFKVSQREILDCSAATRQAVRWGTPRRRRDTSNSSRSQSQSNQSFCSASSLSFNGMESGSFDATSQCSALSKENLDPISPMPPPSGKAESRGGLAAKTTRV
ncbi:rho GTPase-activating protein 19-like [Sycon ciliatum]|uniref:rho GTPase-activating protein 19-like n=1 Tax=Sycon ciliatum TaxID=27933 RepID=UPI0020AC694C|eukprot:scpid64154/ scgid17468/ Rho GTPase-activating protein 19; Rho-type GTPase-activating protein 19